MRISTSIAGTTAVAMASVRQASARLLPALMITLVGCAELTARPDDPLLPGGKIDRMVVADFAAALVERHEPLTTTFQVSRDTRDPVTTRLVERLVELGFGIQRVPQDQGAHFVEHQRDILIPRHGGTRVDDRLTIGRFEARRSFTLTATGDIASASPLQVGDVDLAAGVSPAAKKMTATAPLVSRPPSETPNRVLSWSAAGQVDPSRPLMQVVTKQTVAKVVAAATGLTDLADRPIDDPARLTADREDDTTDVTARASSEAVNNRFYGGDSVFANALDDFERIERRTIVFANDSLKLGRTNKRMLARWLADGFRQNDRFSLIGCSTGQTSLAIGNEGLALGRADRVIEELVSQGVEREDIFSEGCWAPVSAGDTFPGRGVVLELWRRKS